jgi:hypothetical protein
LHLKCGSDVEGNPELTDDFLRCLWRCPQLEHAILSYAVNLSDAGLCRFIRQADHLRILELDNTRITDAVPQEFVKVMRLRKTLGAEIAVVDCRGISRTLLNDIQGYRTRRGQAGWQWSAQSYSNHDRLNEFRDSRQGRLQRQDFAHALVQSHRKELWRLGTVGQHPRQRS